MKASTAITRKTKSALKETRVFNGPKSPAMPVKVCNMDYLNGITRGDEKRVGNLVEAIITEINVELALLKIAIEKTNYPGISNISHNMKSAFAILGVKILEPIIKEMEHLSNTFSSIERLKKLSLHIQSVYKQAKAEMKAGI